MMTTKTNDVRRLSFANKLFYGLASLGTATISSIFAALLPIFYQDYLGLSARWIGIASAIYAIWNAFNDPIFGFITDRTRTKWGRRIPYMRFTAPFLGLTFILVWFAPEGAGEVQLFWWMLVTMLLFDTCYTIIGLVHGALMPELSESDIERNQLSIAGALFGLAGYILGFLLPDFFRPTAGDDASLLNLRIAMVVVGVLSAFVIILATFRIKERREFSLVDDPLEFWESLRHTLANVPFWFFVTMNFMLTLMNSMSTGAVFYLADYVTQTSTFALLVFIFVPVGLGIPLANLVVKRIGLVRGQQLYMFISGLGLVSLAFIPVNMIYISLILTGLGMSGQQSITYNILALVIDDDEVNTGKRREGAFYGANALITKPAQSLALFLTAFILEQTGFVTRAMNFGEIFLDQPESALIGIRSIVGLIPGLALWIAVVILFFFPLRGERLAQLKQKVLEIHAEKENRLAELEGKG